LIRYQYIIKGVVQGVGFRPFVYQLANSLNLCGFVKNKSSGVEIELEGKAKNIKTFFKKLKQNPPPLAQIAFISSKKIKPQKCTKFFILKSKQDKKETFLSPDIAICPQCQKELNDKTNKRFYYPLINCVNCGARWSIIKDLPYDRKNTSMNQFKMCKSCKKEYQNPKSRFYHAQPIGCHKCGPQVRLKNLTNQQAIKEAANLLKNNKILAIKGIGGFHLVCKAQGDVVEVLRKRKRRSKKPFAIMFKNIKEIKKIAHITKEEENLILSKEKPIVIVKKKNQNSFCDVAKDIGYLGVFLPYSGIYHLLFNLIDFPLVVTSANISDTPIAKDKKEIKALKIADEILWYDRKIIRSADDSVVSIVNKKTVFYRLSRGYAPKSFFSPKKLPKILAVGARQKNSICIAFDHLVLLSPYIGDIKNIQSYEYFKKVVKDLCKMYDFFPEIIVSDKHPNYETTLFAKEFAKKNNIKHIQIQHHLSHIYSAKAQMDLSKHPLKDEKFTGFSFDGTGYGDDKKIWGGEVFVEDKRKYHFKYFKIVGGERAIKDISFVAKSIKKYYQFETEDKNFDLMYEKNINSFETSSVGRLFDAVAFFAGLCDYQSYEGYSGLLIEKNYFKTDKRYEFEIKNSEIEIDFQSLIMDKKELIASKFLNTLSEIILHIAKKEQNLAVLSGGVFQNKTLLELTTKKLSQNKIDYFYPTKVPINDSGISLGQVWRAKKEINL